MGASPSSSPNLKAARQLFTSSSKAIPEKFLPLFGPSNSGKTTFFNQACHL
jgi:hypothetical protein